MAAVVAGLLAMAIYGSRNRRRERRMMRNQRLTGPSSYSGSSGSGSSGGGSGRFIDRDN